MTEQVDQLAAIIRHVDGGNRLGAAALAEAILSHPDIRLVLANSDGPDWPARLRNCPTHGQQPPQAWGCPECVRQLREELAAARLHQPLLLQQQHPTPVPVSDRLPGDQLSWWYEPDEEDGYGGRWTLLRIRGGTGAYTHWLPAHALPLPEGEVE